MINILSIIANTTEHCYGIELVEYKERCLLGLVVSKKGLEIGVLYLRIFIG